MTDVHPPPLKQGQAKRRVVFAGAGHAGLIALARLHRRSWQDAEITLVSQASHGHYSGMVPGWIEGLYQKPDLTIPLGPLAERWGLRLHIATIEGATDTALETSEGPVPFDLLVVNTGADASRPPPLNADRVIPAKPFDALMTGLAPKLDVAGSFAVIGGGVAGVEVALALATRRPDALVSLVERGDQAIPSLPSAVQARIHRHFARRGIALHTAASVQAVGNEAITLAGADVPAEICLAFTGATPQAWLASTPFARHSDGFLAVRPTLQSSSHPNVLVVGDTGTRPDDPRPKAGVFSVRAGPHLAAAVTRWLLGQPLPAVNLQRRSLILVATGDRSAVGTRNGFAVEGRWVWQWKNHLDRSFVGQFKA